MSASTCFVCRVCCVWDKVSVFIREIKKSRWEPFTLVHRQSSQPWWSSLLFRTQCLDLWRLPAFVRRSFSRPQNFFVVANERSRFAGLVNLPFQMWRRGRAARSTVDTSRRRLCSAASNTKVERESDWNFIVADIACNRPRNIRVYLHN